MKIIFPLGRSRRALPTWLRKSTLGLWKGSLLVATCALAGCASPDHQPPVTPVPSARYDEVYDLPNRDKVLLVFLPGRGTTGHDFVRQGFVQAVADANHERLDRLSAHFAANHAADYLSPDPVTVDLTYPYYEQQIATRRLHDDLIAPARRAGYEHIWLVGVSMGGLGAIMYDHEFPGEISGVVAIAPFLGEKNIAREIEAAGGLAKWQPKLPLAADDFQRRLWLAIRQARYDQPGRTPLVLGFGTHDRFGDGQRLLAAQLPADHVFTAFGFHDWGTWHRLWETILASPASPLLGSPRPFKHPPRFNLAVAGTGVAVRPMALLNAPTP